MKVSIRVAENFKKEAKPLLKKYRSLKSELAALEQELILNPGLGTLLGNQIFKIRLAIKSKGRGKSGGARVITYLEIEFLTENHIEEITVVNLISIYDKGELDTLSDSEIQKIISNL
jgi:mRNA-degrading endonuclease RelE of RelBE toxin-antitoxin system